MTAFLTFLRDLLTNVWGMANTPAGLTIIGAGAVWILSRVYTAKPLWQQYEGAIIAAVKFAEKAIPDDTPNAGLARLDSALKYVCTAFEEINKRRATIAEQAQLRDGIQQAHAELEAAGMLGKAETTPDELKG